MRRLPRHLFTLCSAASLLLCVAVCVLWVRSWPSPGAVRYGRTYTGQELAVADGHLLYFCWRTADPNWMYKVVRPGLTNAPGTPLALRLPAGEVTAHFSLAGTNVLRYRLRRRAFTDTIWYARVPLWQIALIAALPPALRLLNHRRGRTYARRRAGLCPSCGYDLRASPERCPECGNTAT